MNNFGVIELASARTTSAPGWAYVPDVGSASASAALQPANRKRARNAPGAVNINDLTARQEARIRKEVEALDRDGNRDGTIPLPARSGRASGKHTPNVRKILQSQKTFANHLDDFLALQALAESAPGANSKRPANAGKKDTSATPTTARPSEDTAMADADAPPVLPPPYKPPPAAHTGDHDRLLASRVPDMPSDAELRELLSQPPLAYGEARGTYNNKYPTRSFCQVCGYWGRVRCMKCGTRVCALDCLETHREECVTRYGL